MRRTIALLITSALLVAACGGDDDDSADAAADTAAPPADDAGDAEPTPEGEDGDEGGAAEQADDPEPPVTSPDKPEVQLPAELPTALETTVLIQGDGPPAEVGDTVIVDYVGVRSRDGVEFDNSYDRNQPFPVTLGSNSVIQGWEDGLVGSTTGERLQLDIPSDLAYGDQPRGEVIGENEALTFVIDVRSVIKQADPADGPTEAGVPPSEGATELSIVDLIDGDGDELLIGETAVLHLVMFRADTLVPLDTTWETEPIQVPMAEGNFPGLVFGMPGMKVGGRRALTIPPELGFGQEGNPPLGLPADTDIVLVVDLLGKY